MKAQRDNFVVLKSIIANLSGYNFWGNLIYHQKMAKMIIRYSVI